jgi:hypothetical protein
VSHQHTGYDVMLVPTSAGNRMYDGGVGSGEFSKRVAGFNYVYPNEWLCVSGSVTGAVCGVQAGTNFTRSYCYKNDYGNYECNYDLVEAFQRGGYRATQGGDSGGPVFSLAGDYDVVAKGTISGGNDAGWRFLFQDFVTTNRLWGVRPV